MNLCHLDHKAGQNHAESWLNQFKPVVFCTYSQTDIKTMLVFTHPNGEWYTNKQICDYAYNYICSDHTEFNIGSASAPSGNQQVEGFFALVTAMWPDMLQQEVQILFKLRKHF